MTKLEHFENGTIEFKTNKEFIEFVGKIFKENEEGSEVKLNSPTTYKESLLYIQSYCANFKIINSK